MRAQAANKDTYRAIGVVPAEGVVQVRAVLAAKLTVRTTRAEVLIVHRHAIRPVPKAVERLVAAVGLIRRLLAAAANPYIQVLRAPKVVAGDF